MLLLVMKTKEDAFWMLAIILENVLVNDCYTPNLSGCHVEQRVFHDKLAKSTLEVGAAAAHEGIVEDLVEGLDIGTKELMHITEEIM
ncbi:hypothetical protein GIB67_035688 [Kingdonia uniflora]|uniref:Rab-GAP TBC domain-containing protein n=1 Tax=Kingdonia uniflora TaxID=39325 RepID=A0A7J7MIJ9_9MAGN|nr:hypothetical protein GIB67_035688 [Kingdonia uniflora]